MARGKSVAAAKEEMPLPSGGVDIPDRANHALFKKTLTKEWGIKPWEYDKLTVGDLQDIVLAEHAETYIEAEHQERAQSGGSISKENYDVTESRQKAFQ